MRGFTLIEVLVVVTLILILSERRGDDSLRC